MQTESARMTTAEEARYRINYPNSSPRAVKVVALDHPSEAVVKRVAQGSWQRATFFTAPKIESAPKSGDVALSTTRYDAGRLIALNAHSANGAAEVTKPTAK